MKYLKRSVESVLESWIHDPNRKPLLLRGARQVGKSTIVRELSKKFDHFLEINFEEQQSVHKLFQGDLDPHELCDHLSIFYKTNIIPGRTLLFFDEIQSCIPAITALRYFYEKYPELHLIAAGSLLEFALEEISSFGVGRIRSLFVYPFSFDEFLKAIGEDGLLEAKSAATPERPLPAPIHDRLQVQLRKFLVIGGMPEVVARHSEGYNIQACQQVLDDLIVSLNSDFGKYKKKVPAMRISEVFTSVIQQAGGKFMFTKAVADTSLRHIREALELLIKSGLVIPVTHSSANGLPIGAYSDTKKRKMLVFDTGIFQRILGLDLSDLIFSSDFHVVNKGSIAEMHTGLEILKYSDPFNRKELYYWQREKPGSQAEVDYLVQRQNRIVPVEVKAGTTGAMQSLFLFLREKKLPYGIRVSLENFSSYDKVMVIPLYAVSGMLD